MGASSFILLCTQTVAIQRHGCFAPFPVNTSCWQEMCIFFVCLSITKKNFLSTLLFLIRFSLFLIRFSLFFVRFLWAQQTLVVIGQGTRTTHNYSNPASQRPSGTLFPGVFMCVEKSIVRLIEVSWGAAVMTECTMWPYTERTITWQYIPCTYPSYYDFWMVRLRLPLSLRVYVPFRSCRYQWIFR